MASSNDQEKTKSKFTIFWTFFLLLTGIPIFSSFFRNEQGELSKKFFLWPSIDKNTFDWRLYAGQNLGRLGMLVGLFIFLPLVFYMLINGALLAESLGGSFYGLFIPTVYLASLLFLYILRTLSSAIGLILTKSLLDENKIKSTADY